MTDLDHVYFDADCLLAESCLAIYEALDKPESTDENRDNQPPSTSNQNQVNKQPQKNTTQQNIQQITSNNTQIKPGNNKEDTAYGFTKADLDDPEKIKRIMSKAKKEKNLRAVKTVLRSGISLGALAATTFAAAPLAIVSAATIAANLGMTLNDNKHNREMRQMITLIDSKISKTNGEMFTERDPEKQQAMREYVNALKQAKMKLKSA